MGKVWPGEDTVLGWPVRSWPQGKHCFIHHKGGMVALSLHYLPAAGEQRGPHEHSSGQNAAGSQQLQRVAALESVPDPGLHEEVLVRGQAQAGRTSGRCITDL